MEDFQTNRNGELKPYRVTGNDIHAGYYRRQ
jgi:hypothetical protein